jgi:hypothetical protein
MIEEDGLESCGMLTLTVGQDDGYGRFEQVKDAAEASFRIHALMRRVLPGLFSRAVIVSERHKSGAIHFHLLGSLASREDIRTGFDFDAVKRGDYRSASKYLRGVWKMLRETLPEYGFGRAELTPVRKTGAEVASYVSKYIEKNIGSRTTDDKGKKLVRYMGWKKLQLKPNEFSWATPRASAWRKSARSLASLAGVKERAECSPAFGPRWAFHLSRVMNAAAGNSDNDCLEALENFATRERCRALILERTSRETFTRLRRAETYRNPLAKPWTYRSPNQRAQASLQL